MTGDDLVCQNPYVAGPGEKGECGEWCDDDGETALGNLFQACADLPLKEMDRMEKEINEAAAALSLVSRRERR